MRVCGIIAEYDPFHLGHLHHIRKAREQSGADYVVAVLGCAFSQRGEAMLFATHDRAKMALLSGADLVLGMPVSFSCAQANRFAAGGVGILNSLGVVSHLSFGCEPSGIPYLQPTADLLHRPSPLFTARLKKALSAGHSFAKAQGMALAACLPEAPQEVFSLPNFILGISYLLAIRRLDSVIKPLPVPRQGDYHAQGQEALPSATSVRAALRQGAWPGVAASVSEQGMAVIRDAAEKGRLHFPHALDSLLIGQLLQKRLSPSPEHSEGLDQRILGMAGRASSREELLGLVCTRRYTRARVNRALSHALLGLRLFPASPPHARLLGFKSSAVPLLKAIKTGGFPLIDRPGKSPDPLLVEDMRAEEIWALGAGKPAASAWQYPLIVMDE